MIPDLKPHLDVNTCLHVTFLENYLHFNYSQMKLIHFVLILFFQITSFSTLHIYGFSRLLGDGDNTYCYMCISSSAYYNLYFDQRPHFTSTYSSIHSGTFHHSLVQYFVPWITSCTVWQRYIGS